MGPLTSPSADLQDAYRRFRDFRLGKTEDRVFTHPTCHPAETTGFRPRRLDGKAAVALFVWTVLGCCPARKRAVGWQSGPGPAWEARSIAGSLDPPLVSRAAKSRTACWSAAAPRSSCTRRRRLALRRQGSTPRRYRRTGRDPLCREIGAAAWRPLSVVTQSAIRMHRSRPPGGS